MPTLTPQQQEMLRLAVRLAQENIAHGGGPFGAVIARGDQIIATGVNRVTAHHDPTAHAEVQAIRAACQALGTFSLEGCDIYSSCEPCPMCLSAIYWAHLSRLCYASSKDDAAAAGFDDAFIYRELALDPADRRLATTAMPLPEADAVFRQWVETDEKTAY